MFSFLPLEVVCFPLGAMILVGIGLVITDKHTKLRGLLVLKQKKGKERDEWRAKFELRRREGRPNVDLKGRRGGFSKIFEKDRVEDMICKR